MRVVKTNSSGDLFASEIGHFGGKYSFWETLMRGGIGSPKIVYAAGIPAFDALYRNMAGEVGFASFELLKNGLLFRLNINQRLKVVGCRLSEITAINLVAYRIKIKVNYGDGTLIVHRGELEIVGKDGAKAQFTILADQLEGIKKFFWRKEFDGKFNFSISKNPPEVAPYLGIEWLDVLLNEFR